MRKLLFSMIVAAAIVESCNNDNSDKSAANLALASDTATVKYICPMLCQGDTAYITEGQCPVCEMDLERKE